MRKVIVKVEFEGCLVVMFKITGLIFPVGLGYTSSPIPWNSHYACMVWSRVSLWRLQASPTDVYCFGSRTLIT